MNCCGQKMGTNVDGGYLFCRECKADLTLHALAIIAEDARGENAELREKLGAAERAADKWVRDWEKANKKVAHYEQTVCLESAPPFRHQDGAETKQIDTVKLGALFARAAAGDALLRDLRPFDTDDASESAALCCDAYEADDWIARRDAHLAPPAAGEVKP